MEWYWIAVFVVVSVVVVLVVIGLVRFSPVGLATMLGFPGSGDVSPDARVVIERLGKFHTAVGPGAFWYLPGAFRLRSDVRIAIDTVTLYRDEGHSARKDLSDGSVTVIGAIGVFRIFNPDTPYRDDGTPDAVHGKSGVYRATYGTTDYKRDIKDLLETVLTGHITSYSSVDALLALPNYEFWESELIADIPATEDHPADNVRERVKNAAQQIGMEILRVQVQDFEQTPEARQAREEVNRREREADAASFVAERTAEEVMGAFIAMCATATGRSREQVQQDIDNDRELQKKIWEFARDIVTRKMSIDGKALQDIRIPDGGDLRTIIGGFMARARGT
ncbi:SPFH domain-containing protein [Patescibacteria group bacterium]|nr:SPFH domain-containing protein [Patescibacteria group bacterium]